MFRTREDGTEIGTCESCGTFYDTAQKEPRDIGAGWPRCGLCWAARKEDHFPHCSGCGRGGVLIAFAAPVEGYCADCAALLVAEFAKEVA